MTEPRQDDPRAISLEPFVSPCEALDWRLGHAYWAERGAAAFTLHEVPNGATSDGVRAARAAHLLLDALLDAPDLPDSIAVVEYGMGSGDFARVALDTFQRLCLERDVPAYERLTWFATEHSSTTLRDVQRSRRLDHHAQVVRFALADAADPTTLRTPDGEPLPLPPLDAAFFNYTLDVLPFTALMREHDQWFELRVQTRLHDLDLAQRLTGLDPRDLQTLAADAQGHLHPALLDVAPLLTIERAWFPADIDALDPEHLIRDFARERLDPWLAQHDRLGNLQLTFNHAAIDALLRLAAALRPEGFALISDFGWDRMDTASHAAHYQRFGLSTAVGLAFPLIEYALATRAQPALLIAAPRNDERCHLHTRLISRTPLQRAADTLDALFDGEPIQQAHDLVTQARQAAAQADPQADELYAQAHLLTPESATLLAEWAGVANTLLQNHDLAIERAQRAIDVNPFTSLAWNELGDAHFANERFDLAHQAYLQARDANPLHPRASLNLAWTFTQQQRYDDALQAVHHALEHDRIGLYRDDLIHLQREILDRRIPRNERLLALTRARQSS